jgi:chromosome segregation ATPase
MAWRLILGECRRHLGLESTTLEGALARLVDARLALRSICAGFGDNDWPDDLHPQDVIDKHLWPHLEKLRAKALERHWLARIGAVERKLLVAEQVIESHEENAAALTAQLAEAQQNERDLRRHLDQRASGVDPLTTLLRSEKEALEAQLAEARAWLEKHFPDLLKSGQPVSHVMVVALDMLLRDRAEARETLAATRCELQEAVKLIGSHRADLVAATQRAKQVIDAALAITSQVEYGDKPGTGPWLEIQNVLRSYEEGPPHA